MIVIVFDTETSGLIKDKDFPYILQLSYVVYNTTVNSIVTIEDDYIKIPRDVEITEESHLVHGITKRQCNDHGISIQEALHKFNRYLIMSDKVVGHNVEFDIRMILAEAYRNNISIVFDGDNVYCTMKESADVCKIPVISTKTGKVYNKYPKLNELYLHYYGKDPKNTHNSLVDILLCLVCFGKLHESIDIYKLNRTIRYMIRSHTT
jgi:DNA polymerase III epsilon subunit-like protein